jgi:hypothetical protein
MYVRGGSEVEGSAPPWRTTDLCRPFCKHEILILYIYMTNHF